MEKKIIILAGEPSGDLQAGLLAARLKQLNPGIKIYAMGGEFLKKSGAEIIHDINGLSVLGLFDVLKKIVRFRKLMLFILRKIAEIRPEAIIFVDFSGFNLRIARKIDPAWNIKTIYYISPQIWASRSGRVKTIKEFIDKIIVIFKFERDFYKKFGVAADFVGHPLLDIVKPTMDKKRTLADFGLKETSPVFTLMPGSRLSEIKNILPIMVKSARLIREKIPQAQFIVSKPANLDISVYIKILGDELKHIKIIESKNYDCLNAADFVLVASGTATLETAIMEKPNLIIYKMGLLNYLLYRPLVKIPFIGIENIVAGKMIAPEFIQFRAKPHLIARAALNIISDKQKLSQINKDFQTLKEKLGSPGAPLRAAEAIISFLNEKKYFHQ